MQKLSIFGVGYVGLTAGICFASKGNQVLCVDVDEEKINRLSEGKIPIHEHGLEELLNSRDVKQNISFSSKLAEGLNHGEIIFIAVGTPVDQTGSADLNAIFELSQFIGKNLTEEKTIVIKSTVPVGTSKKIRAIIQNELDARKIEVKFHMASNPEFLREGCALQDFMEPDRVAVGLEDTTLLPSFKKLYLPFIKDEQKFLVMSIESSELLKYAANAFLATKISFINEISRLSESTGADIDSVRQGMTMDPRIGNLFLDAGLGYGGSCLPKDVKVLSSIAQDLKLHLPIIQNIENSNQLQKKFFIEKVASNAYDAKKIALWGLSFKPNTDDIREAPALDVIDYFLDRGVHVAVYDPAAMDNTKRYLASMKSAAANEKLHFSCSSQDCLKEADALIICTEWPEFKNFDLKNIKQLMNRSLVIDGRNLYSQSVMLRMGIDYYPIGNYKKHNLKMGH